jgi:methylmalonyl-CoA mutase N-terminal domain/subunit
VPREKLTGTIQNDILKEYASRGTWIWPPEPSLRLIADTIEFCAAEVPRFNAISVAGAHFRDAGANAVQEMAFTLADGVTYCDTVVERGRMTIDHFAPQISSSIHGTSSRRSPSTGRAGRGRRSRERYSARPRRRRSSGSVCAGAALRLGAPVHLVRVAYEAMAMMLGGPIDSPPPGTSRQSCSESRRRWRSHQVAYNRRDRSVAPTSSRRSPTRPKIEIMHDLGAAAWCDPSRTACGGIADGRSKIHKEIERASVRLGNIFVSEEPPPDIDTYELDAEGRDLQLKRLSRSRRSGTRSRCAPPAAPSRAASDDNLMHKLIDWPTPTAPLAKWSPR